MFSCKPARFTESPCPSYETYTSKKVKDKKEKDKGIKIIDKDKTIINPKFR